MLSGDELCLATLDALGLDRRDSGSHRTLSRILDALGQFS
jgi:hypothetical protein